MTRALTLYQRHSQAALVEMQSKLCADPASRNMDGGPQIYIDSVRRKLSDIAQAITYHLEDKRSAAGNPVPTNGYSGRNAKRRR